jgi:hypothetical protein
MSHRSTTPVIPVLFAALGCVACAHGAARERGELARTPAAAREPALAHARAPRQHAQPEQTKRAFGARSVVALALAEPDDGTLDASSVERARAAGHRALAAMPEVALGGEAVGTLREQAAAARSYAITLRGAFRALELDQRFSRFEVRIAVIDAERHNLIATLRGMGSAEGGDAATRERAAQAALESALRGLPPVLAALPGLAAQGALATR